jgi:mono/diheme cytochrome c family protein
MVGIRHIPLSLAVGLAALAACSSTTPRSHRSSGAATRQRTPASQERAPSTAATTPGETMGAQVFGMHCATCHGPRGEGNLGPSLVSVANRLTVSEELNIVRTGRGRMPAFRSGLTDAEIAAVVDYTRTQLH